MRIIRTVIAYVMGSLLGESGVAAGLDHDDEARRLRLRSAEFPHLTALAAEPRASTTDTDFEFGLDLLVRSVVAMQPTRALAS